MNVEQIQKINDLARDLLRQGLAQDHEEAVAQAERVFQSKADQYNEIRQTMRDVRAEAEPREKSTADLSNEQVKEILEKNTQFLVKTIKEFQEKIKAMEDEMAILKTKVASPPPRPTIIRESRDNPEQFKSAKEQSKPSSGNHPRSGNYNDEDVSIEKFFYTGKK